MPCNTRLFDLFHFRWMQSYLLNSTEIYFKVYCCNTVVIVLVSNKVSHSGHNVSWYWVYYNHNRSIDHRTLYIKSFNYQDNSSFILDIFVCVVHNFLLYTVYIILILVVICGQWVMSIKLNIVLYYKVKNKLLYLIMWRFNQTCDLP